MSVPTKFTKWAAWLWWEFVLVDARILGLRVLFEGSRVETLGLDWDIQVYRCPWFFLRCVIRFHHCHRHDDDNRQH